MFTRMKSKGRVIFLIFLLVFTFFTPLYPGQKQAQAGAVSIIESIPSKMEKVWDTVKEYANKALKTTVMNALMNVATLTTQRLAYDAAMYVSGGGSGGDSLIEPRGFKEYAQMLGEQAVGEFVGSLNQSWAGFDLCEPSPLQKLEFQKSFVQKVDKYKVAGQQPPAPKCNWDSMAKSYTALGESLDDFSIDVDVDFDIQEGQEVIWDTNDITGNVKKITDGFNKMAEKLYNELGINMSKLWTDPETLVRLYSVADIPDDWKNKPELQKKISSVMETSFKIIDEKFETLKKQSVSDEATRTKAEKNENLKSTDTLRQKTAVTKLLEGPLKFWPEIKNKIESSKDNSQYYKELFTNKDYINILLQNKLIDKEVIMKVLVEEKVFTDKITLSLIKSVYLPQIKTALDKKGDDLKQFAEFMQPGQNKSSAALTLGGKLAEKQAELSQKATELANNEGFKSVTNIVSGRVKTPATVVQEKFKEDAIKEPSKAKWSSVTGAYFNADTGTALLNVALSTFTSTVFNNLMDKIYTGLFNPDEMINQNQVGVGLSDKELRARYTTNLNSEILSVNYELNTYNLLDEFIICPEKYETANNCVIDSRWAELLKGGQKLTIKEAIQSGYLDPKWKLIPQNHSLNGEKTCYQKAYCYDNLQKLRRARILPVGFELAANMCADPENSEYCSMSEPVSLGEVVDNFYNCGQDEDHPYSIWCNMIDPNWLLKAPDMKCRLQGYGDEMVSAELPQREEKCVDDVSCIAKDENGKCLGWGYCTKEKNVWRFEGARSCSAVEDSCRTFTDSEGDKLSVLTNTLWLTDFNTCDGTNVGCSWYSKNKIYDIASGYWQWSDQKNDDNEAVDRMYFNNQIETCNEADEGCTRLIRAIPRLGTNLLPNSSLNIFDEISEDFYTFDFWESTTGANLKPYEDNVLLEVTSTTAYKGLLSKSAVHIGAKSEPRYFIYSAKLQVPAYLIGEDDINTLYNFDNQWSLSVDAYKQGVTTPSSSNIYDLFGETSTNEEELEDLYLNSVDTQMADVDLYLRFTTAPDVDRLKVALLALDGISNGEANQVIIESLQLEEVGENDMSPSEHKTYNSDNLFYVKTAPEYYNCYQDWGSYLSPSQCESAQGEWDEIFEVCKAPSRCQNFAPSCTYDEVGCNLFTSIFADIAISGIVKSDDYCPEACGGYTRLYEADTQFSNGGYKNFIPDSADVCSYDSVGCEEYTSLADDGGIESNEYFVYERSCELSSSPDCQIFYTWDTPEASNEEINRYTLKGLNNEPVTSIDDSALCNEEIYNLGTNPNCYKFYAVSGGEDIDLSAGDSEYISYHLIDKTITCSSECKPYRLTRQVTEEQCLGDGSHTLNKFKPTNTETLPDGTEVETGICTVYTILAENNSCSAINLGCREYRGSHSNASFRLLEDSFEFGELSEIWNNGVIVEDAVTYEGHSLNNLNGQVLRAELDSYLYKDNLYVLTFWARSAVDSSQRLEVALSSTDELLSGENGLLLDQNWQKFTLGPVTVTEDTEEAILTFSGISAGNLYIDAVNLIESNDYYYYIADSWTTPSVCDQVPGTGLPVPGYMLGCQAYTDVNDTVHYLKSFSNSCREDAVGCELVIDTKNNIKAENTVYNSGPTLSIGDLVKPIITEEAECLLEGYNWDQGKCHSRFEDAPISQQQCQLWGYYWLGSDVDGRCVNESISDDVPIASDNMKSLVINENYFCSANNMGCKAFGKPTLDADGEVMTCDYGEICSTQNGCPCRLEDSNEYICKVDYGKESCVMDTVYLLDDPQQYYDTLCEANAEGCDKFVDSNDGIWYFRNPGNRVCEYKEVRIGGQLKRGWFKKNSNEPCYENYKPQTGLWGFDHNLDYYIAGIDDLGNYDFYTATCSSDADQCTNFVDPTAMTNSGNRNYYYIWDDAIDISSCNGQVNKADGCILFNNTSRKELVYSAEQTYQNSFEKDMRSVGPVMGADNPTLNPFTSLPNPYYLGEDDISSSDVSVQGTLPYIDSNGTIQNLVYNVNGVLEAEEGSSGSGVYSPSIGGLLGGIENQGGSGSILGSGSSFDASVNGFDTPFISLGEGENLSDLAHKNDIDVLYRDILLNNAENINSNKNENNTNMVIKVARDRVCGEWLDSGDSQVVQNADGASMEVNTNLIACNDFTNTGSVNQCVKPVNNPLQKLDVFNYTLRGFGWDVLDYSGYSVPYMYGLDNYEQVYVNDNGKTALGLNTGLECETASDCSDNSMNYRCIDNTCYNINNGFNKEFSLSDSYTNVGIDKMCRAYPRDDSPLPYSIGINDKYSATNVNTCYAYTGYCVDKFLGVNTSKTCLNDYECSATEQCVFNNTTDNDNCDCSYKRVDYEEGTNTVYTAIDNNQLSNSGICLGGVNDGIPCQEDLDCKVMNRTTFRVEKESNFNTFDGVCVYPDVVTNYYGLEGLCLEKSSDGQCLTWYPADRFIGDADIYDKDPNVAYPENKKYFCLDRSTVVPVLRQGGPGIATDQLCPQKRFGVHSNEYVMPEDVATGKNYYLVDHDDKGGKCDNEEYRKVLLYNGAIVNVTEDKINQIQTDWFSGPNGFDEERTKQAMDRLVSLYKRIQKKWQGQSCLYMLVDMYNLQSSYYYYAEDNYWEDDNIYLSNGGGSDDVWEYPIVVTCRPLNMESWDSNLTDQVFISDLGKKRLDYYGIDPYIHLNDSKTVKSVPIIIEEIKDIYLRYNNNCDIAFQTPGSSGHDEKELLTREFTYLVNNVCEYHNLDKKANFNLYNSILSERNDDEGGSYEQRTSSVLPEGEAEACSVLAEVVDNSDNNKAYTNRISNYSDYMTELREPAKLEKFTTDGNESLFGEVRINDPATSNCQTLVDNGNTSILSTLSNWQTISPAKYSEVNINSFPSPFGAVIANNLYTPYYLDNEALAFQPQSYYNYTGVAQQDIDDLAANESVSDLEWIECTADVDPINLQKTPLFDLFNEVYGFKSFKIKDRIIDKGQELAGIFDLNPVASYSDVNLNEDSVNLQDPFFARYYEQIQNINQGSNFYCEHDDLNGDTKINNDEECVYIGPDMGPEFLGVQDADCIVGTVYTGDGGSDSYTECMLDSTGGIKQIKDSFDLTNYLDITYNMYFDEESETYKGKPNLYYFSEGIADALTANNPETEKTQIVFDITDPDTWYADLDADGEDESIGKAIEYLYRKAFLYDYKHANDTLVGSIDDFSRIVDQPFQGPLLQMKNTTIVFADVDKIRLESGDEAFETVFYYNDIINDNSLYNLSFYAQADKNRLPIKDIVINWGDGNISKFNDYKFKNHLPVCNVNGPMVEYVIGLDEGEQILEGLNEDEMKNENASETGEAGAAGASENCVEEPFEFKHWYTNVKGYDSDGNIICKKGVPLDEDGNILPSTDQEDVVQCMLEGSVKIVDNLGVEAIHPFYIYVPLYLSAISDVNLEYSLYEPVFTIEGVWEPVYSIYTGEEEEESGGFDFVGFPEYTLTP